MISRNLRAWLVFIVILLAFAAVASRAIYLQASPEYKNKLTTEAENRHLRTVKLQPPRGSIYDRHGNLLALSTRVYDVIIDPKYLSHLLVNYRTFLKLVRVKDSELKNLAREQRHKRKSFIRVLPDDPKLLNQIRELSLPGVFITRVDLEWTTPAGKRLRVSKTAPTLWVDWKAIEHYRAAPYKIAKILNLNGSQLSQKIHKRARSRYLVVKRGVQPDLSLAIKDLSLRGVYLESTYRRYYPEGESIANLIGFTNIDDKGADGIERSYNQHLTGLNGQQKVVRDALGNVIDVINISQSAQAGKDIQLAIDQNIQYFAYKTLKEQVNRHDAESASAVILDAKTGEILSMVSLPSYNPNDRSQRVGKGVRNRAVSDYIEPGSTLKPFAIAKGLEYGVVEPDSVINTGRGAFNIQGQRITDTSAHGKIDVATIVQKSSNIGTAKIALKIDPEVYYQDLLDFGFTSASNTYLPGEVTGQINGALHWQPINQVTTSYGYGINMTALTLARAYTVFSNQGRLLPVSLFKLAQPPEGEQVLGAQAATTTLEMMESVAKRGGTAPKAAIKGYRVAGKTGTVHLTASSGGYEGNEYLSVFAGLVPASNPDMIMVVAVKKPSRGIYYGGAIAAPVFQKVMQQALRIRKVAPDDEEWLPKLTPLVLPVSAGLSSDKSGTTQGSGD